MSVVELREHAFFPRVSSWRRRFSRRERARSIASDDPEARSRAAPTDAAISRLFLAGADFDGHFLPDI